MQEKKCEAKLFISDVAENLSSDEICNPVNMVELPVIKGIIGVVDSLDCHSLTTRNFFHNGDS